MTWIFRFAGAALLVCACTAAGMARAGQDRRRRLLEEDILRLLDAVEGGILYRRQPLAQLWRQLTESPGMFRVLRLESASRLPPRQAMEKDLCGGVCAVLLPAEDRAAIRQWVLELGSGPADQEQARLQALRLALRQSRQRLYEEEMRSGRMYLSLGVCLGAAAAILLV